MVTFLSNLDKDFSDALLIQLYNLWTHTSTAIKSNALTIAETAFVLDEGLTISGKPLQERKEVVGYARAIDLLCDCFQEEQRFAEADLFAFHKVML